MKPVLKVMKSAVVKEDSSPSLKKSDTRMEGRFASMLNNISSKPRIFETTLRCIVASEEGESHLEESFYFRNSLLVDKEQNHVIS